MKRIRKFLIRSFALAMLTMLVVGGVLGGFGYKMYRDALAEQPLDLYLYLLGCVQDDCSM